MSNPNTYAKAVVVNKTGTAITNVTLNHRYDHDWNDIKTWDQISAGAESSPMSVGYWTGFLRTGKDYWYVEFADGGGNVRRCKPNFYCFLTDEDENLTVKCCVTHDEMIVAPPKSSECSVALHA